MIDKEKRFKTTLTNYQLLIINYQLSIYAYWI